jgi:hypothetical protein
MTDVQRVSGTRSPFSGRDRAVALLLTLGVLAAIAKPWGSDTDRAGRASPSPLPSPAASTPAAQFAGHAFDPKLFGPFEPHPDWSIWPAGYFISVQYVTRRGVPSTVLSSAPPSSEPSDRASPASSPANAAGPDWPPEIVVGPGDHLLWLGVDTPLGWTIRETTLRRIGPGGSLVVVPITRLPSDWDDHFAVLGIPVAAASGQLTDWPRGDYRLTITVDPGSVTRTISIRIETVPDPAPEPGLDREP